MTTTFLAYELLTGDPIDEIPFTQFKWSETLNRAGGFSATIPARHAKALRNNLQEWRTAIWVDRDGSLMFAGVITKVDVSLDDSPTVSVQGLGPWGYYREGRRTMQTVQGMTNATGVGSEIKFTTVDQFNIVEDLIDHAHYFTGGDPWGLTVTKHGPGVGGISGVTRDRTYYGYERKQIGEAVEQLAGVTNGFDFSFSYAWVAGSPTVTMDLWYPRRGRDLELVFEQRKNIELLSWQSDGSKQANAVTAYGSGDGDNILTASSSDINQIYPNGSFPLLEAVYSYRDVKQAATLSSHAESRRLISQRPTETISVELIDTDEVPLGAFVPGDTITVIVDDGYLNIADRYRVQSIDVTITGSGRDEISVDLVDENQSLVEDA